jgi:hypothetical protein
MTQPPNDGQSPTPGGQSSYDDPTMVTSTGPGSAEPTAPMPATPATTPMPTAPMPATPTVPQQPVAPLPPQPASGTGYPPPAAGHPYANQPVPGQPGAPYPGAPMPPGGPGLPHQPGPGQPYPGYPPAGQPGHSPAPGESPYPPGAQPYAPGQPPYAPTQPYAPGGTQPPKKRGAVIVVVVLVVLLLLCIGGSVAAFLLLRNAEGAAEPVVAVENFLDAVYTDRDAALAATFVCRAARDERALVGKIAEIDAYAARYKTPRFTWTAPTVEEQDAERAVVSTTLTMATGDERTTQQKLTFTVVQSSGWRVCDVG